MATLPFRKPTAKLPLPQGRSKPTVGVAPAPLSAPNGRKPPIARRPVAPAKPVVHNKKAAKPKVVFGPPTPGPAGTWSESMPNEPTASIIDYYTQGIGIDKTVSDDNAVALVIIDGIAVLLTHSYSLKLNNKVEPNMGSLQFPADMFDYASFSNNADKKHTVEIWAGYVTWQEKENLIEGVHGEKVRNIQGVQKFYPKFPRGKFGYRFSGLVDFPEWEYGNNEKWFKLHLMDYFELLKEFIISENFTGQTLDYVDRIIQQKVASMGLGMSLKWDHTDIEGKPLTDHKLISNVTYKPENPKKPNGPKVAEYHYNWIGKSYLEVLQDVAARAGHTMYMAGNILHVGVPRDDVTLWQFSYNTSDTFQIGQDNNINYFSLKDGAFNTGNGTPFIQIEATIAIPTATELKAHKGAARKTVQFFTFPQGTTAYHGVEDSVCVRRQWPKHLTSTKEIEGVKNYLKQAGRAFLRDQKTCTIKLAHANPWMLPNHRARVFSEEFDIIHGDNPINFDKVQLRIMAISEEFGPDGFTQSIELEVDMWSRFRTDKQLLDKWYLLTGIKPQK